MAGSTRLDVLKTLGDNTRYAIYLELARSSRPLTTADVAESLRLHPNTVRPHLERMRDVGLIDVQVGGRGEIGRPQHRYGLAADAPSLGLEPPTMPILARMVLSMAQRLDAVAEDAVAVGHAEGGRRARNHRAARSTLEALVEDLDRLGFDPVVTADPRDDRQRDGEQDGQQDGADADSRAMISFANCPFVDLAREHPDLVCGLHRGMVQGFVDEMNDADVDEFCSLTSRTPCRVSVSTR